MPYFTQNPQSYLALPTMKDAYKTFAIEITFRPDTPDGEKRGQAAEGGGGAPGLPMSQRASIL